MMTTRPPGDTDRGGQRPAPRTGVWFLTLCALAFLVTAPGRITFPDDEIVYQTTEALWERGDLVIAGMAKRTGERKGHVTGTFGWAYSLDGKRYGFFGHGLSVVALPMYGLATATADLAPPTWTHAPRSDLFVFHDRSPRADWSRMVVSLTNCLITPLAAWLLVCWCRALGFRRRASVITGLAYALGTAAWPYTSTFLSEPLSALCLIASAWLIARFHAERSAPLLWAAGAVAGLSPHVHVLNLLALPCLLGYAIAPLWREGTLRTQRRAWIGAFAAGAFGIALLGLSHHLRFGSPLETGRFGHYGQFTWPWEGMVAQVLGPGRSLLIYSPAVVLALFGWRPLRRRLPDVAWFIVSMIVLRWLFVSARSDWYGGWCIGPRYLVPILPFAMLPMVSSVEAWLSRPARPRRLWISGLFGCALFQAWMAAHSIFEHMWRLLMRYDSPEYFAQSHWNPAASPIAGFAQLDAPALALLAQGQLRAAVGTAKLDMLGFGAVRLALADHYGLLVATGLMLAGVGVAGFMLLRSLARPD